MEIGTYIRVKYGVPELSRKFVHFCACSIVIFWPLFDPAHWGWRLNVTVPVVMSLRLLYKVSWYLSIWLVIMVEKLDTIVSILSA